MTKNCVYSIPCICDKVYTDKTCRPLNVRLQKHRKAVVRGEIEKSGMADHIWKEKVNYQTWYDKVKIIDKIEQKRRRPGSILSMAR